MLDWILGVSTVAEVRTTLDGWLHGLVGRSIAPPGRASGELSPIELDLGPTRPRGAVIMTGLTAVSAAAFLWSQSVPGSTFIPSMLSSLGLLLVGGICALVGVMMGWRGFRHRDWSRPRWLVPVVVTVGIVVGLVGIDAALRVRFWLSHDDLQAMAAEALESAGVPLVGWSLVRVHIELVSSGSQEL